MSVADISPTDAYAVGLGGALQWNGTTWTPFAVPAPGGAAPALLNTVAAGSASDVWIAGLYYDTATATDEPFTAHFNGTAWNSVPVPVNEGQFFGITVLSPNDTWMVGYSSSGGSLIENWNGSSWRVVPNPGTGGLLSVTATSAANVTAVGGNNQGASVLNWNGSAWTTVAVPHVRRLRGALFHLRRAGRAADLGVRPEHYRLRRQRADLAQRIGRRGRQR